MSAASADQEPNAPSDPGVPIRTGVLVMPLVWTGVWLVPTAALAGWGLGREAAAPAAAAGAALVLVGGCVLATRPWRPRAKAAWPMVLAAAQGGSAVLAVGAAVTLHFAFAASAIVVLLAAIIAFMTAWVLIAPRVQRELDAPNRSAPRPDPTRTTA